jgi:NADPH:quinone reductase-like Zn-dependent oxidoreductase
MKAVVYTTYGSPDVLQLKDVEKPAPKDKEVLVKVSAASVNSWDWDLLRGRPYLTRLGGFFRPRYPILGADIAGRVEAIGPNVQRLRPGDEVFGDISGCGWGGFAEYVCAREHVLALKPSNLTFEQAAAVPQAAVLALQGLRDKGQIQRGQRVLINGAGGGVGTFAVQIAKSLETEVTGVDSSQKLDMLRSIGADHVIDYAREDFTRNGQRYDLIVDVVANRSVFDHQRALSPDGTLVVIGGATGRIFQVMLLGPVVSKLSGKKLGLLLHKPNLTDLDFLKVQLDSGNISPVIDRLYQLHEVPEALRYFGGGHVQGKIIITV